MKHILKIDAFAGLIAGILGLLLIDWLPGLFNASPELLRFVAAANLAYAAFGFMNLYVLKRGSLLRVLAIANILWGLCCFTYSFAHRDSLTIFGQSQGVLEGAFVMFLGVLELRNFRRIAELNSFR